MAFSSQSGRLIAVRRKSRFRRLTAELKIFPRRLHDFGSRSSMARIGRKSADGAMLLHQHHLPNKSGRESYLSFEMTTRRSVLRKCARLLRWLAPAMLVLFCFQVALLAFPQILFSDSARSGTVTVFHEGLSEERALHLATAIDRKLSGSRFHDPTRSDKLFVFRNRNRYELYRNLLFSSSAPSGFNLSLFGNSYVCEAVVTELGDATGRQPRFSVWDGDLAHIASHEIGHQYVVDRIGSGRWRRLPHWKQEGLPEYIANIGDIHADASLGLVSRIGILVDDARWTTTPSGRRPGWDRVHYEAGLLVEFLLDVQGNSLEQVISDRVTRSDAYAAMMSWASSQNM
jgi:hypothetical protein